MDCPFCQVEKEKTRIIEEGKYSKVIFSNPRLMKGHLLVVPNRHLEKFSELEKEEREEIMNFVAKFQEKILSKIAGGCDVRQNYRPFQKQSKLKVHHFHIHLQPRDFEDDLYEKCQRYETDIFKELPKNEVKELLKTLRD